ncbi:M14 family metallopeptidase [candidate division KSB1 bacterium]
MFSLLRYSYLKQFVLVLSLVLIFTAISAAQDFGKYHNYDEMTAALRSMVNSNSNIAKLESIGKTLEGRDIWLVQIANQSGTPVAERPGIFVSANYEGDHLIGSEISLYMVDYFLRNYNSNSQLKDKIDNNVFYIIPRVNPDAAEMMFSPLKTGRKTNTKPYDGDNDGRMDEDGPEDLNNDGFITVMRVKDTDGQYIIDPGNPRLMKRADTRNGEVGQYKIFWEGIDNDKDGFFNEDPEGGVDINRNFQHAYPYYEPDAGWHMVSELESRAVMDWIIANRNVAVMLTMGESDNLISAPNSRGQISSDKVVNLFAFADASTEGAGRVGMMSGGGGRGRGGGGGMRGGGGGQQQAGGGGGGRGGGGRSAATTVNSSDVRFFAQVSEKYIELTGIRNQPMVRTPEGAFFEYGYYQYGVLSLSTPGWGITGGSAARPGARRPAVPQAGAGGAAPTVGIDDALLRWMESENVDGFVNWQTFNHPDLGEVEIGGFKPYEVTNPPAAMISGAGESHSNYVIYLSTLFADVNIVETEVTNHGGGLFRIKAEVENAGVLPTALAHGITSRSVKPTMVQLGVAPEAIISGNSKTNFIQNLAGNGTRQKFEWLIKGNSGDSIELKLVSQKGGSDSATITLR